MKIPYHIEVRYERRKVYLNNLNNDFSYIKILQIRHCIKGEWTEWEDVKEVDEET